MNDRRAAWALGASVALFYLCFHSYDYNFDGVACAIAVELGDFSRLVHGNHLGYGVLGWAFWSLWRLLGYQGPALLALQTLNSLLDGAACGVFYSALRRAKLPALTAAGAALGLAASQAYWLWSLEAQVYPLGILAMSWALREALSEKPRPAALGLAQAAAVLGHVGHAMFLPAAVYALWRPAQARARNLRLYAAALAAPVLAAYLWAAVFCVKIHSLEQLRSWLLGSAALTVNKEFAWHGGYSLLHLAHWSALTFRIFSDFIALAALGVGAAAAGAWQARLGPRRPQAVFCGLWLGAYAALFLSWEAYTPVYRISDLLPLWLLAALAFERRWRAAPLALAACLGLLNGAFGIFPRTDPLRNTNYQEALWLKEACPPGAWVVVTSLGQVYVPYFAHLKPLNMRYYDGHFDALARRLDDISTRGERVFVTSQTLNGEGWRAWFSGYGLSPAAARDGRALYEVRRKESPEARRRKG